MIIIVYLSGEYFRDIKLYFDSDEHYSGFMVKRVIVSGSPNISTKQIEVKNKQVFVCKFDEGQYNG